MRIFPQLIIALCVLLPLASGKSGHRSVGSLRGRSNVVSSKGEAAEIPQRRALKKVKSGKKNIFETREGEEERDDDEDTMSSSSSSSNDDRSSPSLDDRQSAGRDFGRPDDLRRVDGGTGGARAVNQPTPAPSTPPPILSLVKLYQREQYGALRRVTEPPTPSPRDVEDAGGGDTSGAEVDGEGTTGEDNGEEEEDEEREGRQSGGVDCSLNANGFFGVPTGSVYEVEYLYQVYVVADTSLAILRSQIMPSLDIAVAESILPAFFDCNNARRDRRYLQDNRVEAVSSRRPDEVVLVGLSCSGRSVPGTDCYVVQGYVSLFGTGFRNQAEVDDIVVPVIQTAMQTDSVRRDSSLVLDVTAISDDLSTMNPLPTSMPVISPPSPAPTPGEPTAGEPTGGEPTPAEPTTPEEPTAGEPTTGGGGEVPTTGGGEVPTAPQQPTPADTMPPSISLVPSFGETAAPTATYGPTATWYPTVTGYPTSEDDSTGGGGGDSTDGPPNVEARSSTPDEGIEKMDWWHWLLVGVGAAILLMCGLGLMRGAGTSRQASNRKRSDDDGVAAVGSPNNIVKPKNASTAADRGEAYVPPGMENKTDEVGTFSITPGQPQTYDSNVMEEDEDDDASEEEEDIQYYEDDDEAEDDEQDMGYGDDQPDMGYDDDQPDMGYEDEQDMGYGEDHQDDVDYDDGQYAEDDDQYEDDNDVDRYAGDAEQYAEDVDQYAAGEEDEDHYEEDQDDYVDETYYEEEEETVEDIPSGTAAGSGWENQYAVSPPTDQDKF